MKDLLLVAAGGMLGSVSRYVTGGYFLRAFPTAEFPWGTFVVNIVGCFLIGVCAGLSESLSSLNDEFRLLAISGFLGGFTTFSAFGIETLHLIRSGETSGAIIYITSSVIIGVVCAYLGLKLFVH